MPCSVTDVKGFGIKVNTNFKANPERFGMPRILGLILLLDMESGTPLAIMDSTLITAFRTGAASGVAARYLARKDAENLGVIGSGAQSIQQIQAVAEVRHIKTAYVYSPMLATRREEFLASVRNVLSVPVVIAGSAEEVVRNADILVLCTNSAKPVLDGRWVKEGSFIVAIGNATPTTRELDATTVARSRVVCDSAQACLVEAGDLLLPIQEGVIRKDQIRLDLAEILLDPGLGRQNNDEIILFKSVGLAFEDIVTAAHVYSIAISSGDSLTEFNFFADAAAR
jgi:ornithine cyclodeaminase/alanine dehydrogenase